MTKFYGNIGFEHTVETSPGIWEPIVQPRKCAGDVLTSSRRFENGTGINDNLVLSTRLSIVMDKFVKENFSMIRYVEYLGVKWKVTNAEILYPRIILSLGGVYNGVDDETAASG